ncbi:expressed unknown protein [Seminavis robusta]|uniref:Uncharacterized protein n=1 Tax=Seminavis robusta TaxID=568900 RepID=A0A9N8EPA6_9STRA|nr:expressed unknown protein [Seminavis robusta]|eukprot:Sro1584_g284030.1 n/a (213) ;mRNA; r:13579-14217
MQATTTATTSSTSSAEGSCNRWESCPKRKQDQAAPASPPRHASSGTNSSSRRGSPSPPSLSSTFSGNGNCTSTSKPQLPKRTASLECDQRSPSCYYGSSATTAATVATVEDDGSSTSSTSSGYSACSTTSTSSSSPSYHPVLVMASRERIRKRQGQSLLQKQWRRDDCLRVVSGKKVEGAPPTLPQRTTLEILDMALQETSTSSPTMSSIAA